MRSQCRGRPKPRLAEQHTKDVEKLVANQLADGTWGYWRGCRRMRSSRAGHAGTRARASRRRRPSPRRARRHRKLQRRVRPARGARDGRERETIAYEVRSLRCDAALAAVGTDEARTRNGSTRRDATRAYPIEPRPACSRSSRSSRCREAMRAQLVRSSPARVARPRRARRSRSLRALARAVVAIDDRTIGARARRDDPRGAERRADREAARGLLGEQHGGRWRTTQENLVVLQAMRRYFDTYEAVTPNSPASSGSAMPTTPSTRLSATRWSAPMPRSAGRRSRPARVTTRVRKDRTGTACTTGSASRTRRRSQGRRARCRLHRAPRVRSVDDPNESSRRRAAGRSGSVRACGSARSVIDDAERNVALVDPMPAGSKASTRTSRPRSVRRRSAVDSRGGVTSRCATIAPRRSRSSSILARTVRVHRARDNTRHVRRSADEGRRHVRAGDVRAHRERGRDYSIVTTPERGVGSVAAGSAAHDSVLSVYV